MNHINEKIDQLASDLVLLDLSSEEEQNEFLVSLEELKKFAQESDFGVVSEIIHITQKFLQSIDLSDEKTGNKIFTFLISSLQNVISENDRGSDIFSYAKIFEEELNYLISKETNAGASAVQRSLTETQKAMLPDFISDAVSLLENIENDLLALEEAGHDAEKINTVFRNFHTLKGESGLLGLINLADLTHAAEDLLEQLRSNVLKIDGDIITILLQVVDIIREYFNNFSSDSCEKGTENFYNIKDSLLCLAEEKKNRDQSDGDESKKRIGEILIDNGTIVSEDLENALEIQETSQPNKRIGEILQETQKVTETDVNAAITIQKTLTDASIKIKVDKLDALIELVGELVISETQVIQNPLIKGIDNQRVVKDLAELDRITRRLQEISMGMRLVPVRPTFQKMVRIIRDLSRKSKKSIDVSLLGEDTEIDKNMVEMISDPLVHMVRNSVDHGIESAEERQSKGKDSTGCIKLSAFHKGGNVVVEIHDDGAGIDTEKVFQKALEKGMVKEGEELLKNRICNLIFEPGFSTAEEITDISGRGVGMDVVKRNVEQLRGRIDISTEKDKGSVFSIQLPITLAIIEGIILMSGEERYILPINSVVEFVRPSKKNLTNVAGKEEVYKVHNRMYPLIRLNKYFHFLKSDRPFENSTICLVESDYGRVCLVVEKLLGQQQVVIKNLGKSLKKLRGVSGGAILGDGRVGLILDVNGIVELVKKDAF